jgi:uncharacterized membrane protein YqaE (UPF0057 family)
MAPLAECTRRNDDTAWVSCTWEEWLQRTKRALYVNILLVLLQFNDALPLVRLVVHGLVNWALRNGSVVCMALALVALIMPPSSAWATRYVWFIVGVLLTTLLGHLGGVMAELYIIRHRGYYRDFLFDARKAKLVRLARRGDIQLPPSWLCDQMIDRGMRVIAGLYAEQQQRPIADELVPLLLRQVQGCVLLAWSEHSLLI